jgi:hypothetical protein
MRHGNGTHSDKTDDMRPIASDTLAGTANSTLKWSFRSDGLVIASISGKGMDRNHRFFCSQEYSKIHRIVKLLHVSILYGDHNQTCNLRDLIMQQSKGEAIHVTGLDRP